MKKISKKVALYTPYLDVLGGGEKHVLSILQVLSENNYQPFIFWNDPNIKKKINERFNLFLGDNLTFLPNIFTEKKLIIKKLFFLKKFDIFIYVSDGSYFFSTAKKNYVFCMVPEKKLYPNSLIDRLKTFNFKFIANSKFTQKWLNKWQINSVVLYPYINDQLIDLSTKIKKEKIILSVGRFFSQLHSKKQEIIIETFQKLKKKSAFFKDFKLILIGGLKDEDKDYFNKLRKISRFDPSIIFLSNIDYNQLINWYQRAMFFWHFTGYGVDENKNPQLVEHLGIAPLEAMASGCLVFSYAAGGIKEVIIEGKNGFLFDKDQQLIKKMVKIINQPKEQKKVINEGINFVQKNFSYSIFSQNVKKIFLTNK